MLKLLRPVFLPFLRSLAGNFNAALEHPQQTQAALLKRLVANLANTEYGRSLNVNPGDGYETFAAKVPIADYDDLSDWVERQKKTERQVLVAEPVLFYEKTSGSSAAAKYIPYTRSLKNSFNRMFLVWLADLLTNAPPFESGRTFISISPAFHEQQTTEQSRRIGLEDDTEYLNRWIRLLMNRFFVVPATVKQLTDPAEFKRALSLLLLAEERLEVISVWNPSLLEVILDFIQAHNHRLIDDLNHGAFRAHHLELPFRTPNAERLALLEEEPIVWGKIWPELKLISCWTSAHAAVAARRVQAKFPRVFLQGKGLLATEAPMTLPLIEAQGFVPLLKDVFFEFADEHGKLSLLHELEAGREYEIILTQAAGLYRYRIGDRVRATHFYKETACLEFIGRSAAVCDLVGEKLNEDFVRGCLERLSTANHFQTLLPVMTTPPHYLLITDGQVQGDGSFAAELEKAFCEAWHYRQARLLGQLAAARVTILPKIRDIYFDYFVSKGMKLGDIKHKLLITDTEDATNFLASVSSI